MNATSSPLRGLAWKETRQIVPLVLMLLGVAVLLIFLWSMMSSPATITKLGHYIPVLLPALFAAGAGAILVGQEKESRTLLWCSSLPISPARMIGVKWMVALIGLAVMWVGCIIMGGLIGGGRLPGDAAGGPNRLYLLVHSIFILCCGFYTAWRMKNTFASLIALIPLASMPYLVTSIFYSWFGTGRHVSLQESAWLLSAASAMGVLAMGWLSYRAGVHALSPAPPELEARGPAHWLDAWRPSNSLPVPGTPFRYPLSSLVWQSIHHHRMTLTVLMLTIVLGAAAYGRMFVSNPKFDYISDSVLIMAAIAGAIATSWLGVSVFHGDGSATRVRFLADRGVSPTRVWIGRQWIGLSVLSIAMVAFLLSSCLSLRESEDFHYGVVPSMAMVGCMVWIIYSVSQATSQWIRILAASAFLAPVLSGVAIMWLIAAATAYGAPFWLLLLCSVLPMLATWLMMRRFMDDAAQWPIWLSGVVTTGLVATLPLLPFIIDISSVRGISSDTRAALLAEARRVPAAGAAQSMMSIQSPRNTLFAEHLKPDGDVVKLVESQRFLPQDYLSIGEAATDRNIALRADVGILSQSMVYASYFRYLVTQDAEDAEATESLGRWIDALTTIATRLRLSDRWVDQEVADQVEIWLTQTLSREDLKSIRAHDFAVRAIALISDQEARRKARRRAVLLSWRGKFDSAPSPEKDFRQFGGFRDNDWFVWYPQQKLYWIYDQLIDRLTIDALQMIDAAEADQDTMPIRRKLHQLMVSPSIPFSEGPYAEPSAPLQAQFGFSSMRYPASHWGEKWEDIAKQLANKE